MLKFFRKIRQALIENGHVKKYLLYAAGEILLVMVGILLALQVNNWNEARKARAYERKILAELKSSLQRNIEFSNWAISENESKMLSCQIILNHFDQGIPYHDSLAQHFSNGITWFNSDMRNPAYESLRSIGVHTISNDSIREGLGVMENPWITTLGERNEQYHFNVVAPAITDLFESGEMWGEMKPFDYQELSKSKKYRHILNTLISNRKWNIHFYREWQDGYNGFIQLIDRELSSG